MIECHPPGFLDKCSVKYLGDIVEADDHYTGLHSRDVVELSLAVSEALGLDAEQLRTVEFGALLHDVGKIRVPKEIINKPGKLDPWDWVVIRRHTLEGETMLRQVGGRLASIGRIVRSSLSHPDALAELRRCSGTQFDPLVIEALERLLGSTVRLQGEPTTRPRVAMPEILKLFSRRAPQPPPRPVALRPWSARRRPPAAG